MNRALLLALLSACAEAALPLKPTAWANRDAGASPAVTAPKLAWSFRQNDCKTGSIPLDTPTGSPSALAIAVSAPAGGGCPQKTNGPGAKTYLNARQGVSVTSSSAPGDGLKADTGFTENMNMFLAASSAPSPTPRAPGHFYIEVIFTVRALFEDGTTYRFMEASAQSGTPGVSILAGNTFMALDFTKGPEIDDDILTFGSLSYSFTGQTQCTISEYPSRISLPVGRFSVLEALGNAAVGETWLIGIRVTNTNTTFHIGKMGTELAVDASPILCDTFSMFRLALSKFRLGGAVSTYSSVVADFHWFAIYGGPAASSTLPPDYIIQQHAYSGLPNSNPVGRQSADAFVWIVDENTNTSINLNDTLTYFDQDSDSPKLYKIVTLPSAGKLKYGGGDVIVNQLVTSGETLVYEPAANGFSKAYDGTNTCASSYTTFTYRLSDDICDGIATGSSNDCMLPTDITATVCVRETNAAPQATVAPFSLQVETNADFSVQCVDSDTTVAQLGLSKLTIVSQSHPELGSITLDTCSNGGTAPTLPVDITVSPTPAANVAKTFNLCYRAKPNAGAVTPTVTPSSTDVVTVKCVDKLNAQVTATISVGLTDPNPPTAAPTIPTLAPTTKAPVTTKTPTGPTVPTTEAPTNADGTTGVEASTSSASLVLPSVLAGVLVGLVVVSV